MTQTSWLVFAFFVVAGHDGAVMTELREMAHGMEDADLMKQNYNTNLGKEKLLKIARAKMMVGNPAPKTQEQVNHKGPYIGRLEGPLNQGVNAADEA